MKKLLLLFILIILLVGCSPLQNGWASFERGEWDLAAANWSQSEEPQLQQRAYAAKQMIHLYDKAQLADNKV